MIIYIFYNHNRTNFRKLYLRQITNLRKMQCFLYKKYFLSNSHDEIFVNRKIIETCNKISAKITES